MGLRRPRITGVAPLVIKDARMSCVLDLLLTSTREQTAPNISTARPQHSPPRPSRVGAQFTQLNNRHVGLKPRVEDPRAGGRGAAVHQASYGGDQVARCTHGSNLATALAGLLLHENAPLDRGYVDGRVSPLRPRFASLSLPACATMTQCSQR